MVTRPAAMSFAASVLWLLVGATVASAQLQFSIITGVVRDSVSQPFVGALVTATNPDYKSSAEAETDDLGRFSVIGLQPGRWLFVFQKGGYEPNQGWVNVSRSGRMRITIALDPDPCNAPAPSTGLLAGYQAAEIQARLDAAHDLFDAGDYGAAVEAYEALLSRFPQFTSLNLQIGHAYKALRDHARALAAYHKVPAESPAAAEAKVAIEVFDTDTAGARC